MELSFDSDLPGPPQVRQSRRRKTSGIRRGLHGSASDVPP